MPSLIETTIKHEVFMYSLVQGDPSDKVTIQCISKNVISFWTKAAGLLHNPD